jgi:hypothetical protein
MSVSMMSGDGREGALMCPGADSVSAVLSDISAGGTTTIDQIIETKVLHQPSMLLKGSAGAIVRSHPSNGGYRHRFSPSFGLRHLRNERRGAKAQRRHRPKAAHRSGAKVVGHVIEG